MTIEESGMTFGDYIESDVFQIEKSRQYKDYLAQKSIKTCEFILKRNQKIILIEAKKSCPNVENAENSDEKRQNYQKFVNEIIEKITHSLTLYANIILNRYAKDDISERMLESDLAGYDICPILVVKDAKKEWLIPYQEILYRQLGGFKTIWGIKRFLVLTEEDARKKNLLV